MKAEHHQLSPLEKIGYGLGDAASHIVFDNVTYFMMFFYTDIFGLSAGFAGTMFLLARGLDAVSDPVMGLLADRTRTRWGKFRPYLLWASVPFGILCVLTYTTPDMTVAHKMIFAAATYTALTLAYTVVNIPYCALGGVITGDPTQRISLQSYRFVLATAGGMLSTVLMVPLVNWVDAAHPARGYQGAVAILAGLAVAMFLVCFATTRERIADDQAAPGTFREDIRDICRNDQWRIVGVLTLLNIMGVCVRGGAMIYYVTYFVGDAGSFMRFLFTYFAGNIVGSALAKPLADRFCKVSLFTWLNVALCGLSLAMYFVPPNAVAVMFGFIFVIGVMHQAITPIQWVMMSDTVDYGEWTQGKRLTGISFSGTLFVLKMGLALGGAIIGWTLKGVHYEAGLPHQSPAVMQGILLLFTIFPGALYLLSAWVSRYYKLRRELLGRILGDLERKRG